MLSMLKFEVCQHSFSLAKYPIALLAECKDIIFHWNLSWFFNQQYCQKNNPLLQKKDFIPLSLYFPIVLLCFLSLIFLHFISIRNHTSVLFLKINSAHNNRSFILDFYFVLSKHTAWLLSVFLPLDFFLIWHDSIWETQAYW